MSTSRARLSLLLVLLLVAACCLTLTATASAITTGTPDGTNHPYVCILVFYDQAGEPTGFCSGFAVSPRLIVTAAHATSLGPQARAWFLPELPGIPAEPDPDAFPWGGPGSYHGTTYTYPDWLAWPPPSMAYRDLNDVGVVVLDKAVRLPRYARLPAAGIVDTFAAMHLVDLVGYGANYRTTGAGTRPRDSWVYPLVRTYAPTQLIEQTSVTGADYLKLASNPSQGTGGIIYGDSGGPVLDGGTDVALGDNSYGNGVDGVAYSQRIDIPDILGWIRSFLR